MSAEQAVGQGNTVNDVLFVYNDFGQLTTDYQSHEDAVNLATTPRVQYTYADGAKNTVRPTALVYPNGRELHYDYGSTGEMNDAASRVASLIDDDGTTHLVDYSYLGRGSVVEQESPQPDLLYTLVSLTSSNDPDTGDIYAGLDRFGRVKDLRWRNTDSNTDLSRVEYGYDRASNRIWRKNPTDPNAHYDWLYTYDAIQRLKSGERGTLNSNGTAITDPQFAQCWSLDETGNWRKFLEDDNGDLTWNLNQTRTSSTVNEITNITETAGPSWVTPAYSKAGNMTTMPQPADPTESFTATYDAWNRLTKLADGTDTVQENVYDGRNFRVIQKTYINGDLDKTRQYYFTNNWQIIEERLDSSSNLDRQFVWGIRYIDDLICRDRSESGTLDERLFPLPDANWNVTALVNTSGAVVERIEYDPYGNTIWLSSTLVARANSSYEWETTYCSYHCESDTGLFQVRHRVYHPTIGTWLQRDPLGLFVWINLFSYSKQNPLNLVDPNGLYSQDNTNSGDAVTQRYCAASKKYPKNPWLKCACKVSSRIDAAIFVLDFSVWWFKVQNSAAEDKSKWFKCTRECLQEKWIEAMNNQENGDSLSPKSAWEEWCNKCGAKDSSIDCCEKQVKAEQTELQNCFTKCQGQRVLSPFDTKDFQQEVEAPTAAAAFDSHARLGGMLLEQRQCEAV